MNPVFISDDFSKYAIFPFSFTADCRFCCKITLTKNKRLYHSEFISLTHSNILFQRFVARSLKQVRSGETSQNKANSNQSGPFAVCGLINWREAVEVMASVWRSYSPWHFLYCSRVRTNFEATVPDVLCTVQQWGLLKLEPPTFSVLFKGEENFWSFCPILWSRHHDSNVSLCVCLHTNSPIL
jgi:hypothetical protein